MFEVFPGYNATPMTELGMQLPMSHFGTPYAMDWNNDGVLDLWSHNHYSFSLEENRWSDPSTSKRGPEGKRPGGCMIDWDAILRNGDDGTYYAANDGKGFITWEDANVEECFDAHSTGFFDIDGNGIKDLYLVTGGGRGVGNSADYDNALFWGVPDDSPLGYRLVGGREAAAKAGLGGRSAVGNERGRHQYWFDADGDGDLDVILFNNERKDYKPAPGYLYRNINGRKFEKVETGPRGFAEFATQALLTDMDGDGFAHEIVVPSECVDRDEPSDPPQNGVCERAPRGSINVYRRDAIDLVGS